MTLTNQPSPMPTRKIAAVVISGMVVGGAQAALALLWPDHPFDVLLEELDVWLQAGVMILAGYMTRERTA